MTATPSPSNAMAGSSIASSAATASGASRPATSAVAGASSASSARRPEPSAISVAELHQHLADVAAGEQLEERGRRLLDALVDGLGELHLPGANPLLQLGGPFAGEIAVVVDPEAVDAQALDVDLGEVA